jgi:hypothetical protein
MIQNILLQGFQSDRGALSIEKSYELFDFNIIVAMDCDFVDPRIDGLVCEATGSIFEAENDILVTLKASMNDMVGVFSIGMPYVSIATTEHRGQWAPEQPIIKANKQSSHQVVKRPSSRATK